KPEIALSLVNMAELCHKTGKLAQACQLYKEGLAIFREMGDKINIAGVLETFAYLVMDGEEFEAAAFILGAAQMIRDKAGAPRTPRESRDYDMRIAIMAEKLDRSKFDSAWEKGQCTEIEQAVDYVLALDFQP